MGFNLAVVFGFFLVSAATLFILLTFGRLIRPANPQPIKNSTYECGEVPTGPAWFNFNNRFYIIALIFVVFDVEVALLVPAVVVFRRLVASGAGYLAFAEIFFFLSVLFIALVYFWSMGDLSWDKALVKLESTATEADV